MEWYFMRILLLKLQCDNNNHILFRFRHTNWMAWITRKLYNGFRYYSSFNIVSCTHICHIEKTIRLNANNVIWGCDANRTKFFGCFFLYFLDIFLFHGSSCSLVEASLKLFVPLKIRTRKKHVRRVEECHKKTRLTMPKDTKCWI